MTAHRRGILRRAGAASALAVVAVLIPALPAYADDNLQLQQIDGVTLAVGGGASTVNIKVTNKGDTAPGPGKTVTITAPLAEAQVKVGPASGCQQPNGNIIICNVPGNLGANQTQLFSIPLTPPSTSPIAAGSETSGNGSASLSTGDGAQFKVTLKAPAQQPPPQAQTVTEVSGTVVNQLTADLLGGAAILVTDSAGHDFNATTNDKGTFKVTPTADKPIAPGTLTIGAAKTGFDAGTQTKEGTAGRSVTGVRLALKPNAAASVPPSVPADGGLGAPTTAASTPDIAAPKTANTSGDAGPNLLSWLAIGIGILLFLAGVGAIIVLVLRRKGDRDDPDEAYDEPGPVRGGPGGVPVPASHGVYHGQPDATRVARGGMNDATAIVRPGHPQQPLDEFPDPYAAPASAPGYQSSGGGYAGATQVGYGYNDGSDQGGYGRGGGYPPEPGYPADPRGGRYPADTQASGGRYGAETRYSPPDEPRGAPRYAEEPTGRFTPTAGGYPSAGAYPPGGEQAGPTNGYGGQANGYSGQANGYGSAGQDGAGGQGGYADAGGDYGRGAGGYGPAAGSQPSGGPGYGHEPTNGYAPPNGYQDPRGQGQGGPPNGRGRGDRSVDWLDD